MKGTSVGHFVWHDLVTTDPKGAAAFYTDVVGWKTQSWDQADYTMWVSAQGPIGGIGLLPDSARKAGAPPHWMGHVHVASMEATLAEVRRRDGRVHVEPTAIPTVGRFAIVADPQGASLSLLETGSSEAELHDTTKPGEYCWAELFTTNHEAAFGFYAAIFGWEKSRDFDMGAMGQYRIFAKGGKDIGGMFTQPKDMRMPPAWLHYAQVTDLDASIARAKSKGGKLLNGPMEVPGGARIAQLTDPQGAAFALHQEKR